MRSPVVAWRRGLGRLVWAALIVGAAWEGRRGEWIVALLSRRSARVHGRTGRLRHGAPRLSRPGRL